MDPELQTLVKFPVVLVHRKELCAIAAVLSACMLGCACVLAYSFTNCGERERPGAQVLRIYVAPEGAKVAQQQSGNDGTHSADTGGATDVHSSLPESPAIVAARYGGVGVPTANMSEVFVGLSRRDTSSVAARPNAPGADLAVADARRLGLPHGEATEGSAASAAPASKGASAVYTVVAANVN